MLDRKKQIEQDILSCESKSVLLELPTGYGKTLMALRLLAKRCRPRDRILIVIPRLVLAETWRKEAVKWGFGEYRIGVVTYMSFPKKGGRYKAVVFDEAHHLTERCLRALPMYEADTYILLSATVGADKENQLAQSFPQLAEFRVTMSEAISVGNIPTPNIALVPLELSAEQRARYNDTCRRIEYYKERRASIWCERRWLRLCKDRLVALARAKEPFTRQITSQLCHERMIIFCCDVRQTEAMSDFPINSKDKNADKNINLFNQKRITRISACDMLNEGVNLTQCRIGVFNMINSSARLNVQKVGRILRHPRPLIIFPYFKDTREEEIVGGIVEQYKSTAIITIHEIDDIKDAL